jgi:hypothetical protein
VTWNGKRKACLGFRRIDIADRPARQTDTAAKETALGLLERDRQDRRYILSWLLRGLGLSLSVNAKEAKPYGGITSVNSSEKQITLLFN